jgi:TnpA family transposase
MAKLQSFEQQNSLFRALQAYGRLVKTGFILRYLNQQDYRRRIGEQLNKGERLHDLRCFLFFINQGQLRRLLEEDMSAQAHCRTWVTNAIVVWDTVYIAEILRSDAASGFTVLPEVVTHLSPARYETSILIGLRSLRSD